MTNTLTLSTIYDPLKITFINRHIKIKLISIWCWQKKTYA